MKYKKYVLPNGLRVLFAPLQETEAVTVLAMTRVGSRYETASTSGVSHFLEHMMFKGTEKRPTTLDVSRELDGVGANYNAFTGKEYTGYYVKLGYDHLPLALDIVSDMLWHSRFAQVEVDRERNVIVQEINMYLDNPMMLIEDLFEELLFGAKHPLGRHIAGPKGVVRRLSRREIVGYFRRHYFPKNMVLCVAGKFDPRPTMADIERLFGDRVRQCAAPYSAFRATQRSPRVRLVRRPTEQAQIGLGFLGLPLEHRDRPASTLLGTILGGNMSSRLFIKVRERAGLAYDIHASQSPYHDTGTFYIQAGVSPSRALDALRLIREELTSIRTHGVSSEELEKAKEYVRGKLMLTLEDSEHIAHFLTAQELLTRKILTPKMRIAQLRRVRRSDVQRVAQTLLRDDRANLVCIGPFKHAKPFRALLWGR